LGKRIIKLLKDGKSSWIVAKDVGCSQKTSKRQDRTLKEQTGRNWSHQTVRNRLKEMGFPYRKAKQKPSLTPKQKKTRLQWAKENQLWTLDDWMKRTFSVLSVPDVHSKLTN
uniref:Transposase Tc1-like domain-containing protein n=1 Tax=Stegastes partitus TaxID=144197 RepID=A0A3B5BFX1_9TELE